jgi:hypothetical protein
MIATVQHEMEVEIIALRNCLSPAQASVNERCYLLELDY